MRKAPIRLESKRLVLRPFSVADADDMFCNWGGDPEVTRFMFHDAAASVSDARSRIRGWMLTCGSDEVSIWNYLAVMLKDGNCQIGAVFYAHTNTDARSAEIGYEFGRQWWRQGFATEALGVLLKYLFNVKRLNRVTGVHDTRNPHSGAVMLKCGMRLEGTMRSERLLKGELIDRSHYAILADEYFQQESLQQESLQQI